MNLDSLTSLYNAVPTDWMIIAVLAIFAAFDALRSGARRIASLSLALPVAALLFGAISSAAFLGDAVAQFSSPVPQAALFFILLIGIYILINRIGLAWGSESGQTLQAALAGVAAVALAVVIWIQIPALDALWHFGPQMQLIFGETYRFWWLIGSYAALAFVRS